MSTTAATEIAYGATDIDFGRILEWYSGKALVAVRDQAVPALREAARIGYWPKGAARRVKSLLNKQAPAIRWGRENEGALRSIEFQAPGGDWVTGYYLAHAMQFGIFGLAPTNAETAVRLRSHAGPEQIEALDVAERWARSFTPVARLIEVLDARRPRPVVVFGTLSPTVTKNVGRAMGVDLSTVRAPEIEYEWVEWTIDGTKQGISLGRITWPDGTRHGASRWSAGDDQCHACGHKIKDRTNWFPIVADSAAGGSPASLWVGRDCARKLFGCEVTGDAIYEGRP